nr:response regulator [Pseudoflavonifractor phocaeensis]
MDGVEVTRRVKEYVGPDATIAAMTADAVHEDVVRAGEAGMSVHLAKPIDPERLFR